MEAGSFNSGTDSLVVLAQEVGKVAGAMEVLVGEVTGMRGEINSQSEQLAKGSERMAGIESQVGHLVEQVKVANGRTTKNEKTSRAQGVRIAKLERKWNLLTSFPRLMDKLAERPFWGGVLIAFAAGTVGVAIERFL